MLAACADPAPAVMQPGQAAIGRETVDAIVSNFLYGLSVLALAVPGVVIGLGLLYFTNLGRHR